MAYEIEPGLRWIRTPGHSDGLISLLVDTDDGLVVIASDCVGPLPEYFDQMELPEDFGPERDELLTQWRRIRELDPAIVEWADVVVVEQRDSAFAPMPAGAPELDPRGRDGVVELGEIIAGTATGRSSEDQITLYKSVGVAVQDLAAAALVVAAARERGVGQEIELEEINA